MAGAARAGARSGAGARGPATTRHGSVRRRGGGDLRAPPDASQRGRRLTALRDVNGPYNVGQRTVRRYRPPGEGAPCGTTPRFRALGYTGGTPRPSSEVPVRNSVALGAARAPFTIGGIHATHTHHP